MLLVFRLHVDMDEKTRIEVNKLKQDKKQEINTQSKEDNNSNNNVVMETVAPIASKPIEAVISAKQEVPPPSPLLKIPYILLTTQSQFSTAAKHFSLCKEVAVDCEGVNMSDTGILCLVQIAAPSVSPSIQLFLQVEN